MKEKDFNRDEYIKQYKKENYKQFSTVLKKEEILELDELMAKL